MTPGIAIELANQTASRVVCTPQNEVLFFSNGYIYTP
jgi:hypothetical protein